MIQNDLDLLRQLIISLLRYFGITAVSQYSSANKLLTTFPGGRVYG